MTSKAKDFIPLAEGAEVLGCSTKTVRRYITAGLITGYRVGPRNLRVDRNELVSLARPIPTAGGGLR